MAQPLQRTSRKTGTIYKRPPAIEQAIDDALLQDDVTVAARAKIERGEAGYLPNECLVHLIREARRRGNRTQMNRLVAELFKRCAANLRGSVAETLPAAEQVREEIMSQLVELFAIDGSSEDKLRLDFYEVKFDRAFSKLRINVVRAHLALQKAETVVEDLTRLKQESADDTHEWLAKKECLELIAKRWDLLTEDERTALTLRHLEGLDVESSDPDKPSVTKLMGVSHVTVQKRLRSAEKKLLAALEGKL